ncbi:tRNA nuclease WapA precursor [Novipirellula aureliae]|uniref:tRNA nuclease WapA n=1 Tax=Novipirellula aureliae TaxID=2527966 RepID=A0A5C6DRY8_9BACT|nr:choice-of-anchor C family protein [Novipirellula aureliae]TWU37529.1 tRNA nuclease WapA precursor [Novipirellula aureliae]
MGRLSTSLYGKTATKRKREKRRLSLFQQLEPRMLLASDWTNPSRPLDVNNDAKVTPMDALLVINELNQTGDQSLEFRSNRLGAFYDVNGDGKMSASDALSVINAMTSTANGEDVYAMQFGEGETESAPAGFVSIMFGKLPGNDRQIVSLTPSTHNADFGLHEMGFFAVDDEQGHVDGMLPTDPAYPDAVFRSLDRRVVYSHLNTAKTMETPVYPGGQMVGVYVLQGMNPNGDASSHLRVRSTGDSSMRIGWEEFGSSSWPAVTVGDRGYDDAMIDITIGDPIDANAAPVITNIPNQSIAELTKLSIQTIATDIDLPDDKLTYSLDTAPSGATINSETGVFTWTPTEAQGPGSFEVVLRATDREGEFDTERFTVVVNETNQPPDLAAIATQSVNELSELIVQAIATDPDIPVNTLTYAIANGPSGATIDAATGRFRWTPTEADGPGTTNVTLRVSDGKGGADSETFTITVAEVNRPPVLAAIPAQTINEQTELVVQATATDLDVPANTLTYSLDVAPTGAKIDATTGRFTWTPTEADGPGTANVTVKVSDGSGGSDTESFVITVAEVNTAPVLAKPDDIVSGRGTEISFQATATDVDLPANTLTYTLGTDAPTGATIDPATGQFRWTPEALFVTSTVPITLTVTDSGTPALSDSKTFNVSITGCDSGLDASLNDWTVFESGGSETGKGNVVPGACAAIISEGDSFVVGLERSVVVPETPSAIQLQYEALSFDTDSSGFVRDAFEIAYVDQDGNPLVQNYIAGRDALFNVTEGVAPAHRAGIVVDGNTITIGLNGLPVGTQGKLIVRLVNNDDDTKTTVKLTSFSMVSSTLAAGAPHGVVSNAQMLRSTANTGNFVNTIQDLTPTGPVSVKAGEIFVPSDGGEAQPFTASVEWIKSTFTTRPESAQVMMTPAVIDLNGDNAPEIVFSTYPAGGVTWMQNGVLRAISGTEGTELWSVTDPELAVVGATSIAVGDIDNDQSIDIIAVHESLRLMCFNSDGSLKWMTTEPILSLTEANQQWGGPSIADLDGDGFAEVIMGAAVIAHDGMVRWNHNLDATGTGNNTFGSLSLVVDLTGDGVPEVLAGRTAYKSNGDLLWNSSISDSFNAIGNFNEDAFPEIVAVSLGNVYLLDHLGGIIWGPVAIPGGGEGGAPTVADFDNDGEPEIGVAGASRYTVFETDGQVRWQQPIEDDSSRSTGSSVFDFDGDGIAEAVYGDQTHLRIYQGTDGEVVYSLPKSSCTTFEYPVVVDVDGDGKTEIVAAANTSCGYSSENGIFVLGSENWVPTRPIWNQHSYHITNINDDGSIPTNEANSWEIYNNYRRNEQPTGTLFGKPLITASAANSRFTSGETVLISGNAVAQGKRADGTANTIDWVSVDGHPVDQFDAGGAFLSLVAIQSGRNDFEIIATDAVGQTTPVTLTLWGVEPPANGIDFDTFTDTTEAFSGVYGRTSFADDDRLLFVDLATRNDGVFEAQTPLLVGVKNISDPTISVVGYDGFLPDGTPYFDYTDRVPDGRLKPNQSSESPSISFLNPTRIQFDYDLIFLSQTNQPPAIQTLPKIEAYPGKAYTYDVNATDPDQDILTYSLRTSPSGMTIDGTTGVITWQPTEANLGTVPVSVVVSDGRGGIAVQDYVIAVQPAPPNRPPVITSTPVTMAYLGVSSETRMLYPTGHSSTGEIGVPGSVDVNYELLEVESPSLVVTANPTWVPNDSDSAWIWQQENGEPTGVTRTFRTTLDLIGFSFETIAVQGKWAVDNIGEILLNGQPTSVTLPVYTTDNFTGLHDFTITDGFVPGINTIDFVVQDYGSIAGFRVAEIDVTGIVPDGSVTTQGKPYRYQVQAVDADNDSLIYSIPEPPEGMRIDSKSGIVTWQPRADQVGKHPVTVQVDDGRGGIAEQEFIICVLPDPTNHPPAFISEPNVSVTITDESTVTDPTTHLGVEFPRGDISFADRVVSYVPGTDVGDPYNDPLRSIGTPADSWTSLGEEGVLVVEFVDNRLVDQDEVEDGLDLWIFERGAEVESFQVEISQDGATWIDLGAFKGQPTGIDIGPFIEPGDEFRFVRLTDVLPDESGSPFGEADIDAIGAIGSIQAKGEYRYKAIAIDPDNDKLRYSLVDGPPDLSVDPTSGIVSWLPDSNDIGEHDVVVQVDDGRGGVDTQTFTIHVSSAEGTGEIHGTKFLDANGNGVQEGRNLAGNQDFESGDIRFDTDLRKATNESLVREGRYLIGKDPFDHHNSWPSFGDHTSGDGLMMIVNGATNGVHTVWGQKIKVNANTKYNFGAWAATTFEESPSRIQFFVNGEMIGEDLPLSSTLAEWQYLSAEWFSEEATTVDLAIKNYGAAAGGNDFVLDDIEFSVDGEVEPGLANWVVYLDQNQNGVRDLGERFTVTDVNGDYAFTGLAADTYYVREEMQAGWAQTYPIESASGENLIVNGDFEQGSTTTVWETLVMGSQQLPGWEVVKESVDVVNESHFNSSTGIYSIDLTGEGAGLIAQSFPTVPGSKYSVAFGLAGNTNGAPVIKHMQVKVGDVVEKFEFDVSRYTSENLKYEQHELTFTATSDVSTIEFESFDDGAHGPAIDSISVREIGLLGYYVVNLNEATIVSDRNFGNVQVDAASGNQSPVITSQSVKTATAQDTYLYSVVATDPESDPITYSLPLGPDGMTVHPRLGVVAWTPGHEQVGTHSVVVQAMDANGNVASQAFEVTVGAMNHPPTITSSGVVNAVVGRGYQAALTAQDADGDRLTFSLVEGPDGMTVVQSDITNPSGVVTGYKHSLTWTPTADQVGSHNVEIVVRDGRGGEETQVFELTVAASVANRAPTIDSLPRTSSIVGGAFGYLPVANDADGDALTWSLTTKPTGMTIDPATGVIAWTPAGNQVGEHPVTLVASDSHGGTATQQFTLSIGTQLENSLPMITSNPPIAASRDSGYRYDVVATDADHDLLRYSLDVAPRGMSIDPAAGMIRWQPDAQQFGENRVVVRVTDSLGGSTVQNYSVDVRCGNLAPAIVSVPPTRALTERTYLYPVRADDHERDTLTFRLVAQPDGMTINPTTGVIRWQPAVAQIGEHAVTVEAVDPLGAIGKQTYTVVVASAEEPVDPTKPDGPKLGNRPPLITSTPDFTAVAGALYQYPVTATDLDGDAVTLSLTGPPAGMTMDASGVIRWTPSGTTTGTFPITVVATDAVGAISTQTYVLAVAVNTPPQITSTPPASVAGGAVYRYAVKAVDAENDPLVYSLENAPAGMTIDRVGLIRWQTSASELGTKTFTVRVTDDFGQSATQEVTVNVVADSEAPKVSIRLLSGPTVDLNSSYVVQVTATDNVGVEKLSLKVDGQDKPLSASGRVELSAAELGSVELVATATDAANNMGSANATVSVVDPASNNYNPADTTLPPRTGGTNPTDVNPPLVKILTPEIGSSVTNVIAVTGTVDDPEDRLWYWRLQYARADLVSTSTFDLSDPDWQIITQSTSEVVDGELGKFDPTSLARDGYIIALVGFDNNGQGYIDATSVGVEGGLQLGNFHLEFTDLTLPLAGIPITISRVYDTLSAKDEGDFGYGWSLGVQDARIVEIGAIGTGGINDGGNGQFVPDKTKVYLTNPDGKRVGFTYHEEYQGGCSPFIGCAFGMINTPSFIPDPGVYDTLTIDETSVSRGGILGAFSTGINPDQYTLTTKDGTQYRYDQFTGLEKITDLNGNTVTFSDTGIEHSSGAKIDFVRDNRNRITEIVVPATGTQEALELRYEYDTAGDLRRFVNQSDLATRYEYLLSLSHFLDKVYDSLDRKTIEVRYENNKYVGVFDALGNEIGKQQIDTTNNQGIIRDANGNATTLKYDPRGNVLEETDPLGNTTYREYNDPQNPDLETRIIDRRGMVTDRVYDAQGNVTEIIERGNKDNPLAEPVVTKITYNSRGEVTSITNAAGVTTSFEVSDTGNVTKIINAIGDFSGFTFDDQGRQVAYTDFNGNTTQFEYQSSISPSKVINADGTYQTFEYNQFGLPTTTQTFEADGTLVAKSQTFYDKSGRAIRDLIGDENDPQSPATEVRMFYEGNLLDWEIVVSPESLDASGNLLEDPSTPIDDRKSLITDYVYDSGGRLIRRIDAMGGAINFRYDAEGNRVLLQDPVGNITTWTYDALNRVTEERDPFYWVEYVAANAGEFDGKTGATYLDQILVANQKPSGASLATNQGAAHVRAFGYDPEGNQTEVIDRNNRRREFDYDRSGRLLEERWYAENDGPLVETIAFAYDTIGNLISTSNGTTKHVYTYDTLNQVTSDDNEDNNPNTPHVVLYYEYDSEGNIIKTHDSDGVTVESTYNDRNLLKSRQWYDADISNGEAADTENARIDLLYTATGREKQMVRYSDLSAITKVGVTDYFYDSVGRTTTLGHKDALDKLISNYDYEYDFAGLLSTETRSHQLDQSDQAINYEYDLSGQLVDAVFSGQHDEQFDYDLNGNRLRAVTGESETLSSSVTANELSSDGVFEYEYDGEGNQKLKTRLSDGQVTEYFWDHRNRLVKVEERTSEGVDLRSIEFEYDSFDQRVTKLVDGIAVLRIVHDGAQTWGDYDANGDAETRYLFTDVVDQIVAASRPSEGLTWYYSDKIGTVRDLMQSSGEISPPIIYGVFGTIGSDQIGASWNRYGFAGREYDFELDQYYNRSRNYDPSSGVFTSMDGIGFNSSDSNLYRYVFNSPNQFVDPTGNFAMSSYAILTNVSMNDGTMAGLGFIAGFNYSTFSFVGNFLATNSMSEAADRLMNELSVLLTFHWALSTIDTAGSLLNIPTGPLGKTGAYIDGINPGGAGLALKYLKLEGNATISALAETYGAAKDAYGAIGGPSRFKEQAPTSGGGFINGARTFLAILRRNY